MKALFIVGSCLHMNTSANMSHNSYVKGLVENGYEVDVLMPDNSFGEKDETLSEVPGAKYYVFPYSSKTTLFLEKLKLKILRNSQTVSKVTSESVPVNQSNNSSNSVRAIVKKIYRRLIGYNDIYCQTFFWIKNTFKEYNLCKEYDLIISNSSPAASHKLAAMLINAEKIKSKRWIQIWEDPWAHDLYGNVSANIEKEEQELLSAATEIVYVSPLTLMYQKKFFPTCADKMRCVPLPFFEYEQNTEDIENKGDTFGYFGDYYSKTRNLIPFYESLKKMGYKGYIFGDSDLNLECTDLIEVSPRVTLDKLSQIQNKTAVLVHLCNVRGGQIPGKIYHYSATAKPILFINDGTEEEKKCIHDFFSKYNRYVICENNVDSITEAMMSILNSQKEWKKIEDFCPKSVINTMLSK